MELSRFLLFSALCLAGCGDGTSTSTGSSSAKPAATENAANALSGRIRIDGSSTVYPITVAVAEEFQKEHPGVQVAVSMSGTGGGFKKFDIGETEINDASRPIKPTEIEQIKASGIEYIELPVAIDGMSIIVNPKNDFVDHLTVAELKKMWEPGSTVKTWKDVRDSWPAEDIHLYGAGTDSGTFDYFTEAIMGKSGACRPDYTASEDDNLTIQGVAGDQNALGFLGYAYFVENASLVKAVAIAPEGGKPVHPTPETIMDGTYTPLSRPIFIYVNKAAAEKPELDAFVDFYLAEASALVKEVGYIPLPEKAYDLVQKRFDDRVAGTVFGTGSIVGVGVEELLAKEAAPAAAAGH